MEARESLLSLRTGLNLTQDELAAKLLVTRQAVSRWETGETVPSTDTLKLMSKLFGVSINTLLGQPRNMVCQVCGMPLNDEGVLSRDSDGVVDDEYCKWCNVDGVQQYATIEDVINAAVPHMHMPESDARNYLRTQLPHLRRWKQAEAVH
ncbi:MAG: helix-turn-helix domain-containing protein [Oscillospiraceae bacterium]|jgi:transcriptional regulator with XRE-family HTH domain|nr:helix-turn-helix domain-containing protein [Oscillospiraceae bacterium]